MNAGLRKLLHLNRSQWRVVLQSPVVLMLTWVRLRHGGYRSTLAGLAGARERESAAEDFVVSARETAEALDLAIRLSPWRPKCLVRSLALGWYLSRAQIPFAIRIGVPARECGDGVASAIDFRTHAWVECAGVVLNDRQDIAADFAVFEGGPGPA